MTGVTIRHPTPISISISIAIAIAIFTPRPSPQAFEALACLKIQMFTSATKPAPSRPVPRKRVPSSLSSTLAVASPPPGPPALPSPPATAASTSTPDGVGDSAGSAPPELELTDNAVRETKRKREVLEVEDVQMGGKHGGGARGEGKREGEVKGGKRKEEDLGLFFACRAKELAQARYWECIGASVMLDAMNFGLALLGSSILHWNLTPYFFIAILWAWYRPASTFQPAPGGFTVAQWATSQLCTVLSVCLVLGAVLGSAPGLANALLPFLEWCTTAKAAKEGTPVIEGGRTVVEMATKTVYVVLNSKGAKTGRSRVA